MPIDDYVPLRPNVAHLLELVAEAFAGESFSLILISGFFLQLKQIGNYWYFVTHYIFSTNPDTSKLSEGQGGSFMN